MKYYILHKYLDATPFFSISTLRLVTYMANSLYREDLLREAPAVNRDSSTILNNCKTQAHVRSYPLTIISSSEIQVSQKENSVFDDN